MNEDERLAAFKRGAPTVKSPADTSTTSTERTPKAKPEPKAQVEPKPARASSNPSGFDRIRRIRGIGPHRHTRTGRGYARRRERIGDPQVA